MRYGIFLALLLALPGCRVLVLGDSNSSCVTSMPTQDVADLGADGLHMTPVGQQHRAALAERVLFGG